MSKFLRNLLVQMSKVCQKSKFQIKIERILFLESGHFRFPAQPRHTSLPPPSGPATAHLSPSPFRPSLPCPVSRPTVFLLQKPDQSLPPAPTCAAAAPMTPPIPKMALHFPPFSLPTHPLCFPSPLNRTAGIDAAITSRPIPFPVRLAPPHHSHPRPHFPLFEPEHAPHWSSDCHRPHHRLPTASLPPMLR
jgi:hypothetical protein